MSEAFFDLLAAPDPRYSLGQSVAKSYSRSSWLTDFDWGDTTRYHNSAEYRAQHPAEGHPWFYSAVMTRARNLSQAPLSLWVEDIQHTGDRANIARMLKSQGVGKGWTGPGVGSTRDISRLDHMSRMNGAKVKSMEVVPVASHPLARLLAHPNYLMHGYQFVQLIEMYLASFNEFFVLKQGEDPMKPIAPGERPVALWPINPNRMRPIIDRNRLVGWEWHQQSINDAMGHGDGSGRGDGSSTVLLRPHELIHAAYPDIDNPMRGFSPYRPLSSSLWQDAYANEHNTALTRNHAVPRGILSYDGPLRSPEEEQEVASRWDARFGRSNSGRIAVTGGGVKFQKIGLTPDEMNWSESQNWNRQGILAALGTPPATLGVTDTLNRATQEVQDANLWSKMLLSDVRLIEHAFNYDLAYEEPDTLLIAFDLRTVESLRANQFDKVRRAEKLAGSVLRMPPSLAYETVGLEVVPYFGDDVSMTMQNQIPSREMIASQPDPPSDADDIDASPGVDIDPTSDVDVRPVAPGRDDPLPAIENAMRRMAEGWRDWVCECVRAHRLRGEGDWAAMFCKHVGGHVMALSNAVSSDYSRGVVTPLSMKYASKMDLWLRDGVALSKASHEESMRFVAVESRCLAGELGG